MSTDNRYPKTVDPQYLADALRTLGHPVRLRIVQELFSYGDENREHTVTYLHTKLGTEQSTMSQHLLFMRDRGLLASRREGQKIYYRCDHTFKEIFNTLLAILPA